MEAPNLEKYAQEVNKMPFSPAAPVEIPPLAALAIISHIQLAIRHPGIANSEFSQMAIDAAKQLQKLFDEKSETYKVLELGWNPEADFLQPYMDSPVSEVREKDPQQLQIPESAEPFPSDQM